MRAAVLTPSSTADTGRGWSDFIDSPLGQLTAFVALAAATLTTVQPLHTAPGTVPLGLVLLSIIALGCVAVLAYRDDAG